MSHSQTVNKHDVTHRVSMLWTLLFILVVGLYFLTEYRQPAIPVEYVTEDELFETIVDIGLEYRLVTDENGIVVFCSPTAAQLYGYRHKELLNRNISVTIPDGDRREFLDNFRKLMTEEEVGNVYIGPAVVLKKDGTTADVERVIRIARDHLGELRMVITVTLIEKIHAMPQEEGKAESIRQSLFSRNYGLHRMNNR